MPTPILFVDHAPALGGAEHSLLLLLQHLDRQRWQPNLACVAGKLADRAAELSIPCHRVELPRLRRSASFPRHWWRHAHQLAQMARQIEAGAVYANTVRAAWYGAMAARRAKRPFFWHMRDFWLSENEPSHPQMDKMMKRLLCGMAVRVITNSQIVAAHLPCPNNVTVVHNGIDTNRFDPAQSGAEFRAQYGLTEDVAIVGMIGRLRPWKGQKRFLHMAAQIIEKQPHTHFVIVGGSPFGVEDDYPQQLRQLTTDLNLQNHVTFTGHLTDVRPPLAAFDIFVHPGDPEPFGLVNVEAMAMAKPVVALAHGALPEIVVPGKTGLLVLPGDESGLSQAVLSLLQTPDLCIRMGQIGRERVLSHFSIDRVSREIDGLLRQYVMA